MNIRFFLTSTFLFGGAFLFSNCSNKLPKNPVYPTGNVPYPVSRNLIPAAPPTESLTPALQAQIENFKLIDEDGHLAPPGSPTFRRSPFGILYNLKGGLCTATHLVHGKVIINAHCLEASANRADLYLIFYNTNGQGIYFPAEKIGFIAERTVEDLAVLEIPASIADDIDVAGDEFLEQKDYPKPFLNAQIWGFSMSSTNNVPSSARLTQWNCSLSNKKPVMAGRRKLPDGRKSETPFADPRSNPAFHVFLDRCNEIVPAGASGALILSGDALDSKIGFYNRGVKPPGEAAFKMFTEFVYTGTDGNQKTPKTANLQTDFEFYGVGTAIEGMQSKNPRWLED